MLSFPQGAARRRGPAERRAVQAARGDCAEGAARRGGTGTAAGLCPGLAGPAEPGGSGLESPGADLAAGQCPEGREGPEEQLGRVNVRV